MAQRIDHHVANQKDALAGAAFLEKMLHTVFFGDEKIVGDGVGENAVDLFGHGTVKTAEARFDVSDANAELHGGERNRDRGIDVADDEDEIGLALQKNGLDAFQDLGGLRSVGARADFEVYLGHGDAHLAEENVGKLFVVMLAGVNEEGFNLRMTLHFVHERGDFREVGAGADDIQDFQTLAHEVFATGFETQYSTGVLGIPQGPIAIRAKKVLVQCWEVRFPGKTP